MSHLMQRKRDSIVCRRGAFYEIEPDNENAVDVQCILTEKTRIVDEVASLTKCNLSSVNSRCNGLQMLRMTMSRFGDWWCNKAVEVLSCLYFQSPNNICGVRGRVKLSCIFVSIFSFSAIVYAYFTPFRNAFNPFLISYQFVYSLRQRKEADTDVFLILHLLIIK